MKSQNPRLQINLKKLRENAERIVSLCSSKGITVMGVTKSYSADVKVTKAFYEGGIRIFADSRIENIKNLKEGGIDADFMLLRISSQSEVDEIVEYTDMSVNSEIETIMLLNEAAKRKDKKHGVMLMIDVGDLREGILPDKIDSVVEKIIECNNIDFFGIGTNLGCYGGIVPTYENMTKLVNVAKRIETRFGHKIKVVSAGGTSVTKLIEENNLPQGINSVRLGEALMSGVDSVNLGRPVDGLWKDAFTLIAEIIELKEKPSIPIGKGGPNAFDELNTFIDKGIRKRAILAIGKQDMFLDRLTPYRDGIELLGGSSDHFLLDVTEYKYNLLVGDELSFNVTWDNVLRLTTSSYVKREYVYD